MKSWNSRRVSETDRLADFNLGQLAKAFCVHASTSRGTALQQVGRLWFLGSHSTDGRPPREAHLPDSAETRQARPLACSQGVGKPAASKVLLISISALAWHLRDLLAAVRPAPHRARTLPQLLRPCYLWFLTAERAPVSLPTSLSVICNQEAQKSQRRTNCQDFKLSSGRRDAGVCLF